VTLRSTRLRTQARWVLLTVASAGLCVLGPGAGSATADTCPSSNPANELVLAGGSGQTAQLGKQFQTPLQVELANTNGCPVTGNLAGTYVDFVAPAGGASGTFVSTGSWNSVIGTDTHGTATAPTFVANDTAGSYTVHAESDYGTVRIFLENTAAGLPASVAATGGTSQDAAVDSAYAAPLQARVTDANGNPVQGVSVSFSITLGVTGAGASFLGGQGVATTGSDGVATSPPLLANATPGRFGAVASVTGLSSVVTYALDNHAAADTLDAVGARTQSAAVETRYPQPLAVRVLDSNGQPVEGASVSFSIGQSSSGAGASFVAGGAQASAVTDVNGDARSPRLVAGKTAGSFTVTATAAGSSGVASFTLRNRAGKPDAVTAGAASGESSLVGAHFRVRLVVTVTDADGNPVSGAAVVFRAPARGPGGYFTIRRHGRPHGVLTSRVKTNGKGIAVAPPFRANRRSGGYAVTAVVRGTSKRAAFALLNLRRSGGG
jgi:protocatechuate 3,4-dioxygenase beta subunit